MCGVKHLKKKISSTKLYLEYDLQMYEHSTFLEASYCAVENVRQIHESTARRIMNITRCNSSWLSITNNTSHLPSDAYMHGESFDVNCRPRRKTKNRVPGHWGQVESTYWCRFGEYFNGLVQERRNSSALATELCLYCTNPSICINS